MGAVILFLIAVWVVFVLIGLLVSAVKFLFWVGLIALVVTLVVRFVSGGGRRSRAGL